MKGASQLKTLMRFISLFKIVHQSNILPIIGRHVSSFCQVFDNLNVNDFYNGIGTSGAQKKHITLSKKLFVISRYSIQIKIVKYTRKKD